jgi:hypothetical protein
LLPAARLENVYGDPLVIWVVVGGDDTMEYEVAPATVLKFNAMFELVIVFTVMLSDATAAGVVINGDEVNVPPYPLALDDVIANV